MRPRLALLALGALLVAWLGLAGPLDAPAATPSSTQLPAGWHQSSARLVPRLLMPRERISVATFPMAVGGGGNCGREPVASIRRMRPGDALVTIQEYTVSAKMRRHLTGAFPVRTTAQLADLGGGPIYRATIPFSAHGRAFEALVYSAGKPSRQRRDQIDSLLTRLTPPR